MMTRMNCGRAEKLMPLYAAGDLPAGRRSRAVAAHVASCEACAALADEFRASREWARSAGAVPEFGEEFYESLRAGVLDRVNRDTRQAAPSRLAPFFPAMFAGRRLAFAASLAFAACALALALYFVNGARQPRRNEMAGGPYGSDLVIPPQRAHTSPSPDTKMKEQQPSQDAPRGGSQPVRPRDKTGAAGFKRTPTLRRATPARYTAPERELTAESGKPSQQGVPPSAPRVETANVARIEIQTADPNIRIIWLAPDKSEESEPDRIDPQR